MSINRGMDKEHVAHRGTCMRAHVCVHTHTHTLEYYSAINNEIIPFAEIMPIANNANCQRLSY